MFKHNFLELIVQVLFLVALFVMGSHLQKMLENNQRSIDTNRILVENNKNAIAGNKALLESQEKIHKDQMLLLNEIKNK